MTEDQKKVPPCSRKAVPTPMEEQCPHCGQDIEIWSDEDQAACKECGRTLDNAPR